MVDVVGKYLLPEVGAFIIYAVALVVLTLRPQGILGASEMSAIDLHAAHEAIRRRARLRPVELLFWTGLAISYFLSPLISCCLRRS